MLRSAWFWILAKVIINPYRLVCRKIPGSRVYLLYFLPGPMVHTIFFISATYFQEKEYHGFVILSPLRNLECMVLCLAHLVSHQIHGLSEIVDTPSLRLV